MQNLPDTTGRRWSDVAGAWLGLGAGPGAILLGAGLAARHGGVIPAGSMLLGLVFLSVVLWVGGSLGLQAPWGEGCDRTVIAQRYFSPVMQRILGAIIAAGMIGWIGVNISMGASAVTAFTGLPQWATALLLGAPVAVLAMRGIGGWNRLAAVTTACVLILVGLVALRTIGGAPPLRASWGWEGSKGWSMIAADVAAMLGYVGVFSVRVPDFTARLASRRDLSAVVLLLAAPLAVVVSAGAVVLQRAGSDMIGADVVGVLAGSGDLTIGGLAIGNVLIALAVIAPTFTNFYSGIPALRAATGIGERSAGVVVAVLGLALAAAGFDRHLMPWLGVLGAVVPPVGVPLVTEFVLRRRGCAPRTVPAWPWLVGSLLAGALLAAGSPMAMVAGFAGTGAATVVWRRMTRVTG